MFEKEAEEYALVDLPDGYTKMDYQKKVDWQKGAEFGYNKANEWHYVKDGDLPPLDTKILCWEKCGSTFPVVAKRHIFKEWGKIEWEWECYWGSGYELPQNSVYAWKEIVPPKESE